MEIAVIGSLISGAVGWWMWVNSQTKVRELQIQLDNANRTLESNQQQCQRYDEELRFRADYITKMQDECETRDATIQRQASDIVRLGAQLAAAQRQAAQRRGR